MIRFIGPDSVKSYFSRFLFCGSKRKKNYCRLWMPLAKVTDELRRPTRIDGDDGEKSGSILLIGVQKIAAQSIVGRCGWGMLHAARLGRQADRLMGGIILKLIVIKITSRAKLYKLIHIITDWNWKITFGGPFLSGSLCSSDSIFPVHQTKYLFTEQLSAVGAFAETFEVYRFAPSVLTRLFCDRDTQIPSHKIQKPVAI